MGNARDVSPDNEAFSLPLLPVYKGGGLPGGCLDVCHRSHVQQRRPRPAHLNDGVGHGDAADHNNHAGCGSIHFRRFFRKERT